MSAGAAPDDVPMRRYVRLFSAVVLLFVVQAGFADSTPARVAELLVAGLALLLAAHLDSTRQRFRTIAVVVVGVSSVTVVLQLVFGGEGRWGGGLLLVNVLLVAAGPVIVFGAMRRHPQVTMRTVLGAVTIHVLIGLLFAMLYRSMLLFDPGAFVAVNGELDPAAMQYLSFVTLTTVGFGDIVAVGSGARTAVALQALIGQVYLVTVVAMVVGNLGRARKAVGDT